MCDKEFFKLVIKGCRVFLKNGRPFKEMIHKFVQAIGPLSSVSRMYILRCENKEYATVITDWRFGNTDDIGSIINIEAIYKSTANIKTSIIVNNEPVSGFSRTIPINSKDGSLWGYFVCESEKEICDEHWIDLMNCPSIIEEALMRYHMEAEALKPLKILKLFKDEYEKKQIKTREMIKNIRNEIIDSPRN